MKQSFLDSLVGISIKDAERSCAKLGIKTHTMPFGSATIALAYVNTINIWMNKDGKTVQVATSAGDKVEK